MVLFTDISEIFKCRKTDAFDLVTYTVSVIFCTEISRKKYETTTSMLSTMEGK